MPINNAHTVLVNQCLIECGKLPELNRVWKNTTGSGYTIGSVKKAIKEAIDYLLGVRLAFSIDVLTKIFKKNLRLISFGQEGTPDIIGFLKNGKFIGIEIKTGNARQSKIQENFERVSTEMNCIYIVVRKKGQITEFLKGINYE